MLTPIQTVFAFHLLYYTSLSFNSAVFFKCLFLHSATVKDMKQFNSRQKG